MTNDVDMFALVALRARLMNALIGPGLARLGVCQKTLQRNSPLCDTAPTITPALGTGEWACTGSHIAHGHTLMSGIMFAVVGFYQHRAPMALGVVCIVLCLFAVQSESQSVSENLILILAQCLALKGA